MNIDNVRHVSNGRSFSAALADPYVETVVITSSINLGDADWPERGSIPMMLTRNITVVGSPALVASGDLPALDFAYVKEKARLAGGISLTLREVVLVRYREDVPSSTPGLDLLAHTNDTRRAFLILENTALVNRMCFTQYWARLSVNQSDRQRPQELYPGKQNVSYDLPQLGCVNDTSAPWLRRCYGAVREYWDVATMGFTLGPTGRTEPTNYIVRVVNSRLLCQRVMPEDCANTYGPAGCYYTIYPRNNGTLSIDTAGDAGAGTAAGSAAGDGDGGDGGMSRGAKAGAVAGGVLGGVVLLTAVAAATAAVHSRRRQRRGGHDDPPPPPPAGGGSCRAPHAAAAVGDEAEAAAAVAKGVEPEGKTRAPTIGKSSAPAAGDCDDRGRDRCCQIWHCIVPCGGCCTNGRERAANCSAAANRDLSDRNPTEGTGGAIISKEHPRRCFKGPKTISSSELLVNDDRPENLSAGADAGLMPTCCDAPRVGRRSADMDTKLAAAAASGAEEQESDPRVIVGASNATRGSSGDTCMDRTTAADARTSAPSDCCCPPPPPPPSSGRGGGATADAAVITAATPHRADMMLLGAQQGDLKDREKEVKLLPNGHRGRGSFGRVVEGTYQGQLVAVKLVAEVHCWSGPGEALLSSFAQEVEVLGRCAHPNVVRLLAACLTPPQLCLVMELMDTSLERLLYEGRPADSAVLLPLPTVLHIGLEIAKGLSYLHPTIVHRDLKPGNVLLNNPWSAQPIVKITDFGLARLRSTAIPTNTPHAGTPAYIAPEGLCSNDSIITHQADMYSLAVLLWEMLMGERPWRQCGLVEMAFNIVARGWRLPLEQLSEARCPPKLRAVIRLCWDADPRRRPAAAEVAKSLALMLQECGQQEQQQQQQEQEGSARGAAPPAPPPAPPAGGFLPAASPPLLLPSPATVKAATAARGTIAAAATVAVAGDDINEDQPPMGRVLEDKAHLVAASGYSLTSSAQDAIAAANRVGAETFPLSAALRLTLTVAPPPPAAAVGGGLDVVSGLVRVGAAVAPPPPKHYEDWRPPPVEAAVEAAGAAAVALGSPERAAAVAAGVAVRVPAAAAAACGACWMSSDGASIMVLSRTSSAAAATAHKGGQHE